MIRKVLLLAAVLIALPGCGDDTTTEVETSFVGSYTLQTFDGHSLPVTNSDDEVLTAGVLTLNANDTYSVTLTAHFVGGGDATFSETGTYTIVGNDLTLKSGTDQAETHGTFSGTTVTVMGDNGVYVLKKN